MDFREETPSTSAAVRNMKNPWKAAKKNADKLIKRVSGLTKYASKACQNCRRGKLKCDDVRPCTRCIRRGCADTCCDSTGLRGAMTVAAVERPLRFSEVSVDVAAARRFANPVQFRFIQLHRLWTSGFNERQLRAVFEECPEPLRSVTAEALDAMAVLQAHRMRAMVQQNTAAVVLTSQLEANRPAHNTTEIALLDGMKDAGSYRLTYDAGGQNCQTISVNQTLATLIGGHREEVLARLANCDLPLPASELEFWCLILWDALHSTDAELTASMRWCNNYWGNGTCSPLSYNVEY